MERHDVIVNVEIAVLRRGRYLAMERGRAMAVGAGWLGLPGGKVERERDTRDILEETARREVREEVGLTLDDPVVYVESHTFAIGNDIVLDVVMLARATTGEAHPASPAEVADVGWLTLAERRRQELGW